MRIVLFVLAALLPQAALAQVSYPPNPGAAAQAAQAATDAATAKSKVDQLMLVQAQSVDAVLDASGNYVWDFPIAFTTPPRVAYFPQNMDTSGKPIVCNWQVRTATRLTFHCDKSPGVLTVLLTPLFNPTGAAGSVVTVTARGTLVAAPTIP